MESHPYCSWSLYNFYIFGILQYLLFNPYQSPHSIFKIFPWFFSTAINHKFQINLQLKTKMYSYSAAKEFDRWNEVSQERKRKFGKHSAFNPSPFYWRILFRFKLTKNKRWLCILFFITLHCFNIFIISPSLPAGEWKLV